VGDAFHRRAVEPGLQERTGGGVDDLRPTLVAGQTPCPPLVGTRNVIGSGH
jgi:hypothetical protein